MNILKYNRIKGPKNTVGDYLQTLNNEELQQMYNISFSYELKAPGLLKKLHAELAKRQLNLSPALW